MVKGINSSDLILGVIGLVIVFALWLVGLLEIWALPIYLAVWSIFCVADRTEDKK